MPWKYFHFNPHLHLSLAVIQMSDLEGFVEMALTSAMFVHSGLNFDWTPVTSIKLGWDTSLYYNKQSKVKLPLETTIYSRYLVRNLSAVLTGTHWQEHIDIGYLFTASPIDTLLIISVEEHFLGTWWDEKWQ